MTQGHAAPEGRSRPERGSAVDRAEPVTREGFSAGFDRCFGRVYGYVSRRVNDRESCERIVSEVLAQNLDLLVERGDDRQEFGRLKSSLDRLIGVEAREGRSTGTATP